MVVRKLFQVSELAMWVPHPAQISSANEVTCLVFFFFFLIIQEDENPY